MRRDQEPQLNAFEPTAYISAPMTGLNADEEARTERESLVLAQACRESGYRVHLPNWVPRLGELKSKARPPVFEEELHALEDSDVLTVLASKGAIGVGVMAHTAQGNLMPVIVVRPASEPLTPMVAETNVVADITYTDISDAVSPLSKTLRRLAPDLIRRRSHDIGEGLSALIGANVRRARERKGWTREFLAKRIGGITESSVAHVEAGRWELGVRCLYLFADRLGISVHSLLDTSMAHDDAKALEHGAIVSFFERNDLGLGKFRTFVSGYDARHPTATTAPTDEELWTIYLALFPRAG